MPEKYFLRAFPIFTREKNGFQLLTGSLERLIPLQTNIQQLILRKRVAGYTSLAHICAGVFFTFNHNNDVSKWEDPKQTTKKNESVFSNITHFILTNGSYQFYLKLEPYQIGKLSITSQA